MLSCRAHRLFLSHETFLGTFRSLSYAKPIHRLKHLRRGQNLSERYRRLERSLRGKEELSKEISDLATSAVVPGITIFRPAFEPQLEIYRGFRIPKPPRPPEDDECCMSNCAICVYDLHEESLDAYRDSIAEIRTSLSSSNIPQDEWPPSLREPDSKETTGRKEAVLSAFEEMEKALMKKHQPKSETASEVKDGR